jgi:prepilin-type N-terminal cleavage/methylation domain-containing protein
MKNTAPYPSALTARSKQRGFTLVEMTIVLGIIGIVVAAIWIAAGPVFLNNQVNQATQEMQTVVENMLPLYQGRAWPPAVVAGCPDITGNAISAGAIPSSNVTGACTASQVWGGAGTFTISANAAGAPAGNTFRISFANVPLQGCIALLMQATGCDPSQAGCPVQVTASGGSKQPGAASAGGWHAAPNPLTPSTANALCSSTGPVAFDFKL